MKGKLNPLRLPSFQRPAIVPEQYDKSVVQTILDQLRQMARTLTARVELVVDDDEVVTISAADSPFDITPGIRTVLANATAGAIVVNRPLAAAHRNRPIAVVKIDASGNTVTDTPQPGELINGAATRVLAAQYTGHDACSDGTTNWVVVP